MLLPISKTCMALLATYLATAEGAPTTLKRAVFGYESAQNSVNDCGDSTFVDESSPASPLISDCQHLASNIAGGGTWTIGEDDQRTLATYGTCAFGVEVESGFVGYVGNQDIIDLINSSIEMFAWGALVGAKGEMSCQGPGGGSITDWGLYHT